MVSHPLRSVSIVYVPDNGRTLPHRCHHRLRSIELDTRRPGSLCTALASASRSSQTSPELAIVRGLPKSKPDPDSTRQILRMHHLHTSTFFPDSPQRVESHTLPVPHSKKKGMDDANCTRYSGCDAGWGSDSAWSAFACSCVSPCPCAWLWPCRASACCCACS